MSSPTRFQEQSSALLPLAPLPIYFVEMSGVILHFPSLPALTPSSHNVSPIAPLK